MLAKKYRLPIQSVLSKKSRLIRGRYLHLKVIEPAHSYGRFGVVVSAAVAPLATRRNAIKRALYGALPQSPTARPAYDVIILVQRAASRAEPAQLARELVDLLRPTP